MFGSTNQTKSCSISNIMGNPRLDSQGMVLPTGTSRRLIVKPGTIIQVFDPYPHHPQYHKPDDPYGKLGVILEEIPRLPGGPTKFKVLIGDSIHTFPIHTLEQK